MIIIRLSGGLGNQMFQYALYRKLLALGREVKFDDRTEYALDNARPIMLSVFGISYQKASTREIREMRDASGGLPDRVRRKLFGRKSLEYSEAEGRYDPEVLELEEAYLCGCFQSERYFADIGEILRKQFDVRPEEIKQEPFSGFFKYRERIGKSRAVSIHIRRGDYLAADEVYGGICTEAYYEGAIRYLTECAKDLTFYVFSNDTQWAAEWCRRQEEPERFTVVEGSSEDTGYADLLLMSLCSRHIIANSSFSWWGAWLAKGNYEDTVIIAPAKWLNTAGCQDIFTPDMIRFDAQGRRVDEGGAMDGRA